MKKHHKPYLLLVVFCCSLLFSGCSNDVDESSFDTDTNATTTEITLSASDVAALLVTEPEYVQWYMQTNNIISPEFKNANKVNKQLAKLKDNLTDEECYYLDYNGIRYSQTKSDEPEYLYIGEMKSKKPNGIGILYTANNDRWLVYEGEFKNGQYEGYGKIYDLSIFDYIGISPTYWAGIPGELYELMLNIYGTTEEQFRTRLNGLIYEGEFVNGLSEGRGIRFIYPTWGTDAPNSCKYDDYTGTYKYFPNGNTLNRNIEITCGDFKHGEPNGKYKTYLYGYLSLDADITDSKGSITSYYKESTQIKYEGEVDDGSYHGKGTLYNEDGSVFYSGEWRNGYYDDRQ